MPGGSPEVTRRRWLRSDLLPGHSSHRHRHCRRYRSRRPSRPRPRTQTSSLSFRPHGDHRFSGNGAPPQSLPPGVAPIDKTVIDVDAPSLSVFDLSTLGGAPQGRTISPAVKLSIKAKHRPSVSARLRHGKDGGPPNLYAAATSAYGLQIVSSKPDADGVLFVSKPARRMRNS